MFPRSFVFSAALAAMTGLPAIAQPLEVSTLAVFGADRISVSPNPTAPHYTCPGRKSVWLGHAFILTVRGRWNFPAEGLTRLYRTAKRLCRNSEDAW